MRNLHHPLRRLVRIKSTITIAASPPHMESTMLTRTSRIPRSNKASLVPALISACRTIVACPRYTNFRAVKKTSLLYIPIPSFSSSVKESDSYVPEAADGLSLGGAIFASRDDSALRMKTGRGCRKQLVVVGRLYY